MAFFEGSKMTAGYGDGPDIISSCTINVDKGEIVAILGPNGAGKSTAMKTMLGLLNLKSGSVLIDGEDITILVCQPLLEHLQYRRLTQFAGRHLTQPQSDCVRAPAPHPIAHSQYIGFQRIKRLRPILATMDIRAVGQMQSVLQFHGAELNTRRTVRGNEETLT